MITLQLQSLQIQVPEILLMTAYSEQMIRDSKIPCLQNLAYGCNNRVLPTKLIELNDYD